MESLFIQYICLILIILALVMLAEKLRVAYPIVLVASGLLLSFAGGFSRITIDPEIVFFIFLPPLLYEAAWKVSWKEFWRWRRLIAGFAFPIVIITSCVVAFASHWLIPGFTLALGFLLGGIVSPPDAISATTILRRVEVPKSLVSIAEGESLLNDASSLIVFRFSVAAVITGQFHFGEAAVSFVFVIVMGIAIGLLVGAIFYAVHRYLPTTSSIEIVLTLVTPYVMYYVAEHFHFSGVLAVVSGGLFLSYKRRRLLSVESRIQAANVWTNLVFVLNGLIFLLIGLELPIITKQLGDISLGSAILYGLVISIVLMVTRLACTLGTSVFTRLMSNFVRVEESNPGWRNPIIFGWMGMRGVVSLAMALSVPLVIGGSQAFPYRNLILFITFVVILVTLIFQGLTLPWVIKKVKPEDKNTEISEPRQEIIIQKKIALAALQYLDEKYGGEAEGKNEFVANLRAKTNTDLRYYEQILDENQSNESANAALRRGQTAYLELLEEKRKVLDRMNRKTEFNEDLIRKYAALIDLEEYKIRERLVSEDAPE